MHRVLVYVVIFQREDKWKGGNMQFAHILV